MGTEAMKLGRHLGVVHDLRTLQLADYVEKRKLPAAPRRVTHSTPVLRRGGYPLFRNDSLGDCTCATAGHMELTWSHGEVRLTDAEVVAAYSKVSGYPAAGDNGAYVLDVLNLWRTVGVGGRRLHSFAALKLRDHQLVHTACWLFGGVYIGMALPVSAQAQVGRRWQVVKQDAEPGSWGGHAVHVADSDEHGVTVITWGRKQRMAWDFWDAYVDEAYALVSPEWLHHAHGSESPQGFNLQALEADLEQLRR